MRVGVDRLMGRMRYIRWRWASASFSNIQKPLPSAIPSGVNAASREKATSVEISVDRCIAVQGRKRRKMLGTARLDNIH